MLTVLKFLVRLSELLLLVPIRLVRFAVEWIAFNPRLGPLRYVVIAGLAYVAFALLLVYVLAPLRGITGQYTMGDQIRYDAERWVATAIYDRSGNFVGTFEPRHDSQRDVNYTDAVITVGDHTANPDHKSIPVRAIPDAYWQCLKFHEDRYLGTALNPYGIDLVGVLKIPYSSILRSIKARRPVLGVGGSTLPMQFARVIYKTPPSTSEGGLVKLRRKLQEWWLAPVIYQTLTAGGDDTPLKQWAANHLWLAQRTGGAPLHGVEMTARVVFGKEAVELTTAEQYVLASAVNKPIILLPGSDKLNEVRLDRWRYITEVRARTCAERLISNEAEQKQVVFDLVTMAGGPPDPKVKRKLQVTLETYAPALAKRATANPMIRAAALMPTERFGLREEMKQRYGFAWRDHVRGVRSTLDVAENLAFRGRARAKLGELDRELAAKIHAGYTLDPAKLAASNIATGIKSPNVIVVAANANGEIVRYYDGGQTASYFGSPVARDADTGVYVASRESRMVASVGKILAAVAIANDGRDEAGTLYADSEAPSGGGVGLDGCRRGDQPGQRKAIVAFACSLNAPLLSRASALGQGRMRHLIDRFGFQMPPRDGAGGGTPPSTAVVLGQIAGSPRRVHQMSAVVLSSLIGHGGKPVRQPSLIKAFDYTARPDAHPGGTAAALTPAGDIIIPNAIIKPQARGLLKSLLQAPLCHTSGGQPAGTLKSISHWCAARRPGVRLHFAKTGTKPTLDASQTVDTWITGGVQFANGAAYSYVVLAGTGSGNEPWATNINAAQVTPLVDLLLADLEAHAKNNPAIYLLPPKPKAAPIVADAGPTESGASASVGAKSKGFRPLSAAERESAFGSN
ncbi:MAG: transglycosylase domain-containing protein [Hyphomicrobium aestuarii]|nr:transglycosylase domain-containing protein [Hyphomicrobium aestuarii]